MKDELACSDLTRGSLHR